MSSKRDQERAWRRNMNANWRASHAAYVARRAADTACVAEPDAQQAQVIVETMAEIARQIESQ